MTTLAVVPDLSSLAERINREHEACEASYRGALEHAYRAGLMLAEVKSSLDHGEWLPWLKQNVAVSQPQAWRYLKLAENWNQLSESNYSRGNNLSDLSIKAALKQIGRTQKVETDATPTISSESPSLHDEWDHEAKRKASRAYDLLYEAAVALDTARTAEQLRAAAALARRATTIIEEMAEQA